MRLGRGGKAYVAELRAILVATGVSDGKMEEGSMRVDANVSVRRRRRAARHPLRDQEPQLAARSLGRAIDYEARRQIDLLDGGRDGSARRPATGTRTTGRTSRCGSKEEADDYRYFPEPDLVPLEPSTEWIEDIRAALPLLPAARRARLAEAVGGRPASMPTRSR